nr:hypothetical protein [Prevotella nigrescens]
MVEDVSTGVGCKKYISMVESTVKKISEQKKSLPTSRRLMDWTFAKNVFAKNTIKDTGRLSLSKWYNKVEEAGFPFS